MAHYGTDLDKFYEFIYIRPLTQQTFTHRMAYAACHSTLFSDTDSANVGKI